MHHVAMMINDKHDGFYDDILPSVRLDLAEANVGCVNQRGAAAVAQLQAALPQMVAAIGVGCSSDVMDISNVDFRAQASFDAVVVSGSSTAPAIADETSYPNVARMATGEGPGGGPGHAALAAHYAWTKVAVLSTDSGWAIGASAAFTEAFTATPGNVVLNEGDSLTQAFSIDALDNNPDSNGPIVAMLERLISLNTRIVYLCAEPRIQERIFRTVYQTGLMCASPSPLSPQQPKLGTAAAPVQPQPPQPSLALPPLLLLIRDLHPPANPPHAQVRRRVRVDHRVGDRGCPHP